MGDGVGVGVDSAVTGLVVGADATGEVLGVDAGSALSSTKLEIL